MRLRALLVLALLCAAGPAHALSAVLHFDGTVSFLSGTSAPSFTALGLWLGTPVHYEVRVDTDANGFRRQNGTLTWYQDEWTAPDDHTERFYAEMLVAPYPTPGTYFGWDLVYFSGSTITTPAYGCQPVGRLFVGPAVHYIDGCDAAVEDWPLGKAVVSFNSWHDGDTGQYVVVRSNLTLTDIVPVPEPGATAMLASGATLLACLHRSRLRS